MRLWQSLLANHVIPSIFDAAATLLLVILIFRVFKIKNPATRFMALLLPLIKPFIIFLDSSSTMAEQADLMNTLHMPFLIALRLPDPLNFLTPAREEIASFTYEGSMVIIATAILIITIIAVLIRRWIQLYRFLSSFKREEPLSKVDYPQLYKILDRLVAKYNINHPKIVDTNETNIAPFSIGRKKPVIVLSKQLINSLSERQLEIILAHELAHIKRNDTLFAWIMVILRDILFFNPPTHSAFIMAEEEKEKACDRLALEKTGFSPHDLASTLIDVAIIHQNRTLQKQPCPSVIRGFVFNKSTIERRVGSILEPFYLRKSSVAGTIFKAFLFILVLYLQVGFIFRVKDMLFFLR
ncbi:MAG: M56 family metallopeptidase [Actinomycetota bacterium]